MKCNAMQNTNAKRQCKTPMQNTIARQGCDAKLREEGGKPYVTDNDNYIVDLYFTEPIKDANQAGKEVRIASFAVVVVVVVV